MIILGNGGHALEILCVLQSNNISSIYFYDDINKQHNIKHNYPVISNKDDLKLHFKIDPHFIIGTGTIDSRIVLAQLATSCGGIMESLISKNSIICNINSYIGRGVNIMPYTFISNNTSIGEGSLINTGVYIHHEVTIGKFCIISPKATLLGNSSLGDNCYIGASATILPGIKIGNNSIIGAGAVVTKNLDNNSLVKGVPAK